MASTDLQVNKSTQDLVAMLDADSLQPLFDGSSPMAVSVREMSKIMTTEVEDGTLRTDHKVDLPVEIDMPLMLTDDVRNLYNNLRKAWKDGANITVQTRLGTYPNMMIYEIPHDETGEQGDSALIQIKMREVIVIKPEFGTLPPSKVAKPSQASTVKKGNQQTTTADAPTKRKTSALYQVFN